MQWSNKQYPPAWSGYNTLPIQKKVKPVFHPIFVCIFKLLYDLYLILILLPFIVMILGSHNRSPFSYLLLVFLMPECKASCINLTHWISFLNCFILWLACLYIHSIISCFYCCFYHHLWVCSPSLNKYLSSQLFSQNVKVTNHFSDIS